MYICISIHGYEYIEYRLFDFDYDMDHDITDYWLESANQLCPYPRLAAMRPHQPAKFYKALMAGDLSGGNATSTLKALTREHGDHDAEFLDQWNDDAEVYPVYPSPEAAEGLCEMSTLSETRRCRLRTVKL